jgi:hypothetical protein
MLEEPTFRQSTRSPGESPDRSYESTPESTHESIASGNLHLADVSQSIFASLGLGECQNKLQIAPSMGSEVLFLVDGLGAFIFEEFAHLIPAMANAEVSAPIKSHFPSTTVTNLSSLATGLYPGEHGMVGYTMRIPFATPDTPQLLNGLKWDHRIDPKTWQRSDTLFERGARSSIAVSHIAARRYQGSGFTEAALRGARYLGAQGDEEILSALKESVKSDPSFTYLYLNDVDEAGHSDGVGSEKWINALKRVDQLFLAITRQLRRGVRLWLLADHGMINAGEKVVIGEGNHLLDGVALLGGEPRARHLYLERREDQLPLDQVRDRWIDFFGDRVEILTPELGYGSDLRPEIRDRIGDLIMVPRDKTVLIEAERKATQSLMVGHHGGISAAEVDISLRYFSK